MIGRGGRPYLYPETNTYMDSFILLDMGDNIEAGGMGRYNDDVDWEYIFWNPKLPKPGVSSVKTCPDCGAINYVSARFCTANVEDWLKDI